MTATFTVSAYYNNNKGTGSPSHLVVHARFDSYEAAAEAVARFPKSYRLVAVKGRYDGHDYGVVRTTVKLEGDDANGGKNETGIKRYRALLTKAEKLGYKVEYVAGQAVNAYLTRAELDAVLDA